MLFMLAHVRFLLTRLVRCAGECVPRQVITFIDLAGHEKYLKTTVFGLTGCAPEFAMLMVRGPHRPSGCRAR